MKTSFQLFCRATRPYNFHSIVEFVQREGSFRQQQRKFTTPAVENEMGKDKDKVSYQLKVPKGTKDWEGKDMVIRDKIFGNITDVFKRHGAVTIDTLVNLPALNTPVL